MEQQVAMMTSSTAYDDVHGLRGQIWKFLAFVAVLMTLVYLVLGYKSAGCFPVLKMIYGFENVSRFVEARTSFGKIPGAGYLFQFYGVLLPIVSVLFLLKNFGLRLRKASMLTVFLLVMTSFVLLAPGHRAPLLFFGVYIAIAISYYFGTLNHRLVRRVGIISLMAFLLLTMGKFSEDQSIKRAMFYSANRIFVIQAIGPQYIFSVYPDNHDFLEGASLIHDLKGILPGVQKGMSSLLPEMRGVKSHTNPIGVMGDMYINFGWAGALLYMFCAGVFSQTLHIWLSNRKKRTISNIAVGSMIGMALAYSVIAGAVGVLFQFGMVTSLIVLFLVRMDTLLGWLGKRNTLASNSIGFQND